MPGCYSIQHIQLLTCQFFRSMIGVVFMVTQRRQFLQTHLSQGERKLIWEYLFIQTMQEINSPDDPKLYAYAWLSKYQATIKTSVFGAESVSIKIIMETLQESNTRCSSWDFQPWDRRWFMGTIYQLFTTHSGQIPHWRKIRIQFVTMQLGNMWKWRNVWWVMYHQWTTCQIFVQKLFQVEQRGSTLTPFFLTSLYVPMVWA